LQAPCRPARISYPPQVGGVGHFRRCISPSRAAKGEDLDDETDCRERERAGELADAPVVRLPQPIEVVGEAPVDLREVVSDGIEALIEAGASLGKDQLPLWKKDEDARPDRDDKGGERDNHEGSRLGCRNAC
jgi:hypothetical protein